MSTNSTLAGCRTRPLRPESLQVPSAAQNDNETAMGARHRSIGLYSMFAMGCWTSPQTQFRHRKKTSSCFPTIKYLQSLRYDTMLLASHEPLVCLKLAKSDYLRWSWAVSRCSLSGSVCMWVSGVSDSLLESNIHCMHNNWKSVHKNQEAFRRCVSARSYPRQLARLSIAHAKDCNIPSLFVAAELSCLVIFSNLRHDSLHIIHPHRKKIKSVWE